MNDLLNRIDKNLIKEAKVLLSDSTKISIIPHSGPDGDAIGSSLALYQYLKKKVKQHPTLDVLNGIAYNPDTKTIFVTGKHWDKLFEIEIVEN